MEQIHKAFCDDDHKTIRQALAQNPGLKKLINEPIGAFDSPAIMSARSREMVDVLLEAGADINAKSKWWAGGFCLLDFAKDDLAQYAIQRGAKVEVHAAARLGMMDRLRELIEKTPALVNARGGDGKTPLHFARNIEVAKYLLEKGADINARDVDHESTPAQYLIGEHPEVARFLVERGAETDIFLAAALGDLNLVKKHLKQDPNSIRARVDAQTFPMRNPRAGGTVYQWSLGFHFSPHEVARKFGHTAVLRYLMEQSPADVRLENACWLGDEAAVKRILKENPGIGAKTHGIANAARNNETKVVRLMLDAGIPLNQTGQHGGTPLHWAAWHGNIEMVNVILERGGKSLIPIKDNDFNGTPMRWVIHGSENGWHKATGKYGEVTKALLAAGAERPKEIEGSAEVRAALKSG